MSAAKKSSRMQKKQPKDCYFYYYSTCEKGQTCSFRHEPAARQCEKVCDDWKKGQCVKSHCQLRHMDLKGKDRSGITCFWESKPEGCTKPFCPFKHKKKDDTAGTTNSALSSPQDITAVEWLCVCDEKHVLYTRNTHTIDSSDIEKCYKKNPEGRMPFSFEYKNTLTNFSLDFKNMQQRNLKSGKIHDIKRHVITKVASTDKTKSDSKTKANTPCYWENKPGGCPYKHQKKRQTVEWYWMDNGNKYQQYSKTTCSMDSKTIEVNYQVDKKGTILFTTPAGYTYALDFNKMMQTNLKTFKQRSVERRSVLSNPAANDQRLPQPPPHWKPMTYRNAYELVELSCMSDEYRKVADAFHKTMPDIRIIGIERVQNPFLWANYENQKMRMMAIYNNNETKVNERLLFHGTPAVNLPRICRDNFEWRLSGTNSGHSYGQGVYFSASAAYSARYCRSQISPSLVFSIPIVRKLFASSVLIGSVTQGYANVRVPPENPKTGHRFDTTVDSVTDPSIFVKYTESSYYPSYVITF